MPNEVKYKDVRGPSDSPIYHERLATNGFYTGHSLGWPMQDATVPDALESLYAVEKNTIHYGTITPDAGDSNFPVLDSGK